jgi:DNA-binding protein H-NS
MRKPRDYDAELKALNDKARQLKERKVHQMGELVIATGADALPIEQLAGLLLAGKESKDPSARENWRKRGAAFFRRGADSNAGSDRRDQGGTAQNNGDTQSSAGQPREN